MNQPRSHSSFYSVTTAIRTASVVALALSIALLSPFGGRAQADETCLSPYMAKITGEEDFLYVWTLGVEGGGRRIGQAGNHRRSRQFENVRKSHPHGVRWRTP